MNPLSGLLFVARHALRSSLTPRRSLLMLGVALLPPAITLLMLGASPRTPGLKQFLMIAVFPLLQFAVPFPALFLGVGVIGDEIEARTITYLFTRPLARGIFYLGKLLGFCAAYGGLLVVSVLATAMLFRTRIELGNEVVAGTVGIAVGGFAVYASFFALLRLVMRRALFVGFLLTFITEVAISKMPISGLSQFSIWHHLALLQVRLLGLSPSGLPALRGIAPDETAKGAIIVLASIFVFCLGAGIALVQRREFRLPAAVAG